MCLGIVAQVQGRVNGKKKLIKNKENLSNLPVFVGIKLTTAN